MINPERSFQAYEEYNKITKGSDPYCLIGLSKFYERGVVVDKDKSYARELVERAKRIDPDINKSEEPGQELTSTVKNGDRNEKTGGRAQDSNPL